MEFRESPREKERDRAPMADLGPGRPTVETPPHPDRNCKPELVVTSQMEIRQLEASTAALHAAVLHQTRAAAATAAVVSALCFRGPARREGGVAEIAASRRRRSAKAVAVSGKAARDIINPTKNKGENRVLYIYFNILRFNCLKKN